MQKDEVKLLITSAAVLSAFIFAAIGVECTGNRTLAYELLIAGWSFNLLVTIFAWIRFSFVGMNK